MLFYIKDEGKTLTLKEYSEELVKNKELINTDTIVSRELYNEKALWIIDSTGTAYKVDKTKIECYE
jgi:hypothetical protein